MTINELNGIKYMYHASLIKICENKPQRNQDNQKRKVWPN